MLEILDEQQLCPKTYRNLDFQTFCTDFSTFSGKKEIALDSITDKISEVPIAFLNGVKINVRH